MAGSWGANPEELESLSASMTRASDRLGQMSREATSALHADIWRGSDAQRARSQWDGTLRPQLQNVVASLSQCSELLRDHAREQRDASSSGVSGNAAADVSTRSASDVQTDVQSTSGPSRSTPEEEARGHSWVEDREKVHIQEYDPATGVTSESSGYKGWRVEQDLEGGLDADGAHVSVHSGMEVGVGVEQRYEKDFGDFSGDFAMRTDVGAEVDADGELSLSMDGLHGDVGFDAQAGASIGAEVGIKNDLFEVGAEGEFNAGVSASGVVSADFSPERVGVSVKLGAAVGLGFSGSVEVSVNPKAVVNAVTDWLGF